MIPKKIMSAFIDGRIAVHTGQRFAREFLEDCEKIGLIWRDGRRPTNFIPSDYGDNLCFGNSGLGISYGHAVYMKRNGWLVIDIEDKPKGSDKGDMPYFDATDIQSIVDAESKVDTVSAFAKICNTCTSCGFRDLYGCEKCCVRKVYQLKMQVFALDDFTGAVMRQLKTPDMADSVMRVMAMERK